MEYDHLENLEDYEDDEAAAAAAAPVDIFMSSQAKEANKLKQMRNSKLMNENGGSEEEDDEFQHEMELELEKRVREAAGSEVILATEASSSSSSNYLDKNEKDYVSDDDDDDDEFGEEEEEAKKKMSVETTTTTTTTRELLYDPDQDDENQKWIDKVRITSMNNPESFKSGVKPLPKSDAVLNCPACFIAVCLDCQRHEIYHHQYRAMFVVNCTVNPNEKLLFPVSSSSKKRKKRKKGEWLELEDGGQTYHPVTCDRCSTRVAVYDSDEIYHFFNVIASYA